MVEEITGKNMLNSLLRVGSWSSSHLSAHRIKGAPGVNVTYLEKLPLSSGKLAMSESKCRMQACLKIFHKPRMQNALD